MTIVGVVSNVRQQWLPSGEFDPIVYRVVRSGSAPGDAGAGAVGVRTSRSRRIRQRSGTGARPRPALSADEHGGQDAGASLWPQRLFGSMFALFASIAMLLATCGLYAVTAYAVSRRTGKSASEWHSEPMPAVSGGQ